MDEPSVKVITRSFDPEIDPAYVYTSWRNNLYYSSSKPNEKDNDLFFKNQTSKIRKLLKSATVKVACLDDCPTVIIGYAVSTGTHLHWVYVKADYRNRGIATLLVPKDFETVSDHLTKTGQALVDKKKLKTKGD